VSDTPKTLFEQEIARSEMLANRVAELEKEVRIFSAMNDEKVKLLQGRDQRIEELQKDLAECFRLSGADPDGNEDWRLAPDAVQEVRRLREESDAADSQVLAAQEALKVPAIRYEQCIAHERYPWPMMKATYSPPMVTRCPNCESEKAIAAAQGDK